MKYESDLVYLLRANGASKKDCEEADKRLKETICRSRKYMGDDLYTNLLFLNLLNKKPRIIPGELWQRVSSLRIKGLITPSVYSKGVYREAITLKGISSLGRVCSDMKPTDQKEFDKNVAYLDSKMNSVF